MTPNRGRRVVALALTAAVAAVSLASCTGGSPSPGTARTSGPLMTPVQPGSTSSAPAVDVAATPTTAGTRAGTDAVARWSLAQAGLKAAHHARYTVIGRVDLGGSQVTYSRRFTVDADAHVLEVRATLRGDGRAEDFDLVVAPQGAYVRVPSGSGSWRRASNADLARAGVERAAEEISALPVPLATFVAESDVGFREISGNVDVKEGLRALGLGTLVADGQELGTELYGELYTTVTLDASGTLEKARIDGRDSTGWDDTTVYGGSKEMSEEELRALLSLLDVSITIQSVDRPIAITVPKKSEIRG